MRYAEWLVATAATGVQDITDLVGVTIEVCADQAEAALGLSIVAERIASATDWNLLTLKIHWRVRLGGSQVSYPAPSAGLEAS